MEDKKDDKDLEILNIKIENRFGEDDRFSIYRKDVPKKFM